MSTGAVVCLRQHRVRQDRRRLVRLHSLLGLHCTLRIVSLARKRRPARITRPHSVCWMGLLTWAPCCCVRTAFFVEVVLADIAAAHVDLSSRPVMPLAMHHEQVRLHPLINPFRSPVRPAPARPAFVRGGIRRAVPKGFPFFHVEWEDGGYAQIIEGEVGVGFLYFFHGQ